jgi:hypothetical protein
MQNSVLSTVGLKILRTVLTAVVTSECKNLVTRDVLNLSYESFKSWKNLVFRFQ